MAKRKPKRHAAVTAAAAKRKKTLKKGLLWRLDEGITYSSLSTWLQCPEQFALKYIEGATSKRLSEPLEFGSIIHHALEHQFVASPQEVIQKVCTEYRKYRKTTLNTSQIDALDRLLGLAAVTYPQYCEYWKQDDKKIDWLSREEKFKVPYTVSLPDGSNRRILLRGMRDGVYRNKAGVGIFETKTKSRISDQEILEGLHSDMQTMLYIVATMLERGGEKPVQVKYNVIRRSGVVFRVKDTLDSYLQRVEEDIMTRPDFYFKRYLVTLTEKDVQNFITRTLDPQLVLFIQWWDSVKNDLSKAGRFRSPYHHLNSMNLIGKYGKTDMFDAVFGRRSGYYTRQETFPELDDSFQITWD